MRTQAASSTCESRASSVGPAIRSRRQARGLSLEALGKLVGCARSYLSAIETGRRGAPSDALLGRLERTLRFDPDELVALADRSRLAPSVRSRLRALESGQAEARRLASMVIAHDDIAGEARRLAERLLAIDAERAHDLPVVLERDLGAWPADRGVASAMGERCEWWPHWPGAALGVRLDADAMAPEYRAGDLVLFGDPIDHPPTLGREGLVRTAHGAFFRSLHPAVDGSAGAATPDVMALVARQASAPPRLIERDRLIAWHPVIALIRPAEPQTGDGG